jgi:hypothetical protein
MHPSVATIAEKIQTLRPEQIVEVEDFVEFLRLRDRDRSLMQGVTAASNP